MALSTEPMVPCPAPAWVWRDARFVSLFFEGFAMGPASPVRCPGVNIRSRSGGTSTCPAAAALVQAPRSRHQVRPPASDGVYVGTFSPGPPSVRGCSAYGPAPILPRACPALDCA